MLGYAAVLNGLGQLSESERVIREVIDMLECKTNLSDEEIVPEGLVDALTKLVAVLKAQNKLVDAKVFSEKLLVIQEHRMGKDDLDVLGTMNMIAGIDLVASGKERSDVSLQSTRELLATVLTGYQKVLGRDHTRALYVENNLASLCDQMGDLFTAKFLYERAMVGQQKALDATKMNSFRTHYNYGNLLRKIGEQQKAMEMHLSALEGFTNILGPDHPCTQMAAAALEELATSCISSRGEVNKEQRNDSVVKTPVRTSRKSIGADAAASGVKLESTKNGSGLKKSGIPRRISPMGNKIVLKNKSESMYLLSPQSLANGHFPQSSSTEIDAELWVSEQWMRSKEKAKRQQHQQLQWSETEEAAVMGMAAATTTAVKKLTFDSYSYGERSVF
jgi:tetratricopeptide (TPR) repeat protein